MPGITLTFEMSLWLTQEVIAISPPLKRICTKGGPAKVDLYVAAEQSRPAGGTRQVDWLRLEAMFLE